MYNDLDAHMTRGTCTINAYIPQWLHETRRTHYLGAKCVGNLWEKIKINNI